MTRKHVLVIAANGYIGSAVCRAFTRAGYRVFGLVRRTEAVATLAANEAIPIIGSLSDAQALQDLLSPLAETLDVIVGCAEPPDYISHIQEAIVAIRQLAQLSNRNHVRPLVLWSSGCKDYGSITGFDGAPGLAPHTETSLLNPPSIVVPRATWSPKMLEQTDLFDAAVLRPTSVYGHSSSYFGSIFGYAAKAFSSGAQSLTLRDVNPKNIMHALHVDDCAEAYVALAEHADRSAVAGQFFNISARRYETAEMVLQALAKEYGFTQGANFAFGGDRSEAETSMIPLFGFSQWVSSDKVRNLTGWTDRQQLFSENLGVYRRSYEAAEIAGHEDLARIKSRQKIWKLEKWQPAS